ncbi:hypothetical protein EKH57_11940 [Halorubrum sp. BOL3-1]|uniref:hypothetical protein n=1 Tax=Halorubrum sp. BOL3-1 TaxID=2497325 RepID=UPI001004F5E5|nr:hypothetical protein [Halorubrum sp. BOL3-1]QAU13367.1 hypothetical protein EKH57_11940 [Halorubrum sp. BOL3-1]
MLQRTWTAFTSGSWWVSWKLLVSLTAVYTVGSVAVAVVGIAGASRIGSNQGDAAGFAALAFTLFAFVAIVALAAAVLFALLLYYGVGKPVVAVVLIGIGLYVYRASGWFEGFLPLFMIAALSGCVALYEWGGTGDLIRQ